MYMCVSVEFNRSMQPTIQIGGRVGGRVGSMWVIYIPTWIQVWNAFKLGSDIPFGPGCKSYCILETASNLLTKVWGLQIEATEQTSPTFLALFSCRKQRFRVFLHFFVAENSPVKTATLSTGQAGQQGRTLAVSVAAAVICVRRS